MSAPWSVPLFSSLTIPTDAGEGESRVFIGQPLPEPLASYVYSDGSVISSAILFYPGGGDDDNYQYIAVTNTTTAGNQRVVWGQVHEGVIDEIDPGNPAGFKNVYDATTDTPTLFVSSPELVYLSSGVTGSGLGDIVLDAEGSIRLDGADIIVERDNLLSNDGMPYHYGTSGSVTTGPSAANSFTQAVSFPIEFPTVPQVCVNINSGAGATAKWFARAIHVSTTGFTLYAASADGGTDTFSEEFQWIAVCPQ